MLLQLQDASLEKRKKILLLFVRELIKNSESPETKLWKENKKQELKEEKEKILAMAPMPALRTAVGIKPVFKKLPQPFKIKRNLPLPVLRIPEPRLPMHLQNIQPIPTNYPIPLGKLEKLINNPSVQAVECPGPDQEIILRTPQPKQTKVKLTKEEIDTLIKGFAQTAGIPLNQGLNTFVVGSLKLSAIISDIIGSKFILKKIKYPLKNRFS